MRRLYPRRRGTATYHRGRWAYCQTLDSETRTFIGCEPEGSPRSTQRVVQCSEADAESARSALQSAADKAETVVAQEEVSNEEPDNTTPAAPADDAARDEGGVRHTYG